MRSGLLLMMMAITFLVASEHAQAVDSTRDLVNECQSLERGKRGTGHRIRIPKTKTALLCWGYMKHRPTGLRLFSIVLSRWPALRSARSLISKAHRVRSAANGTAFGLRRVGRGSPREA